MNSADATADDAAARCDCGYPADSFACKIRHVAVNTANLKADRER